jgi:hypothetical protein
MPANWSTLQSQLSTYFDNNQVSKSERDTAQIIANSYYTSILSANIVTIPGSILVAPAPPSLIANGFENTFRILKSKGGVPTAADYSPAAAGIVQFWLASRWAPLPPPPGYVGPITGNQTISGGSPAPLNYDIWNAFNNNIPGKVGAVIATKLVAAFSAHLTLVQGIYVGLIPSPAGPVPGPPFPWLGVA